MWVRSLGQEDALEEGTATHSSILAWRILQTEKSVYRVARVTSYTQMVIQLTDLGGDEVKYGSENIEAVLEHLKKNISSAVAFLRFVLGCGGSLSPCRLQLRKGCNSCCISGASVAVVSLLFPSAGWPVSQSVGSRGSRAQLLRGMWDPLDQGSNPCLLHWQEDSLPLSHQGSPRTLETHMDTSCFTEEKTQLLYSLYLQENPIISMGNVISKINVRILYAQSVHCHTLYSLKVIHIYSERKSIQSQNWFIPKRIQRAEREKWDQKGEAC